MRFWYVGLIHDWRLAQADLRRKHFLVHVPKTFERVQEGRKTHCRVTMRFPGYLFVGCEPHEVGPIRTAEGMDDSAGFPLVGAQGGQAPYVLPSGYMERLRWMEDDEFAAATAPKRPEARKDLTPGDMVELPAGHRGHYFGSDRGVASVLVGHVMVKTEEANLKRIEAERKAA